MKDIKHKVMAISAGLAIAAGAVVGAALPASAIERTYCGSDQLNLVSSQTTCWQRAGYISVNLQGVYSIVSGNNAGYIQANTGTHYFNKWQSKGIPYSQVSGIRIY